MRRVACEVYSVESGVQSAVCIMRGRDVCGVERRVRNIKFRA